MDARREQVMRGFVHHVDLSVSDLARARPLYEAVLGHMGYVADYGARGQDYDLLVGGA